MNAERFGKVLILGALLLVAKLTPAFAEFLIVTRDRHGAEIVVADTLKVNGRNKIRLLSKVEEGSDPISARDLRKAGVRKLEELTLILDAESRVLRPAAERGAVVLPERLEEEEPFSPLALAQALEVSFRRVGEKEMESIELQRLLAIAGSKDVTAAAVRLLKPDGPLWQTREYDAIVRAVVSEFAGSELLETLRREVTLELSAILESFHQGGHTRELEAASGLAVTFTELFPDSDELRLVSDEIVEIATRVSTLRAQLDRLARQGEWQAYLALYREYEPYDVDSSDHRRVRQAAYIAVSRELAREAEETFSSGSPVEALRLLDRAHRLDPKDPEINERLQLLTTEVKKAARESALANAREGLQPASIARELTEGLRHVEAGRFEEAEEEIAQAVRLEPDSWEVLLLEARLRLAQGELSRALSLLDRAALVSPDVNEVEKLRREVLLELESREPAMLERMAAAFESGLYPESYREAAEGLRMDPDHSEYLYYGAMSAAALRRADSARDLLRRYLAMTDSTAGDPERRKLALRVLHRVDNDAPLETGEQKHWLSGARLPDDVPYCPISGTLNARIASITATKNLDVQFDWDDRGRLLRVSRSYEKSNTGTNIGLALLGGALAGYTGNTTMIPQFGSETDDRDFIFEYNDADMVERVAYAARSEKTTASSFAVQPSVDANGIARGSLVHQDPGKIYEEEDKTWANITFRNHPDFDPVVVELLSGPVTVGFSGNAFFDPFIWEGLHVFHLDYDHHGRIRQAREVESTNVVDFEWDGSRLERVVVSTEAGPSYERLLVYRGARLDHELVRSGKHHYRVEYEYGGNELIRATFQDQGIHDRRRRTVTFVQPATGHDAKTLGR